MKKEESEMNKAVQRDPESKGNLVLRVGGVLKRRSRLGYEVAMRMRAARCRFGIRSLLRGVGYEEYGRVYRCDFVFLSAASCHDRKRQQAAAVQGGCAAS